MKQTNNFKLLLIAFIGFYANNSFAQTLVNEEWATYSALSDTIDIAQSTIDINGNVIITGNILVAGQQANIITTKLDQNGNIIWQQQFNGISNGNDYGTAITADGNGNIYVVGSTFTDATNDQDFVSIKYDASGILMWTQQYNGTGSGFDEPSAITVDNANNLFVTGQSKGQSSLQDYATIKYNWYGIEQWVKRYDFVNLDDLPSAIVADNLGGVMVTGSSKSSTTNADYTTIKYDISGNQTAILRHSMHPSGLDKATSMIKDYTGNIYITGGEYINGYRDIKTIKLNSNLAVQWVQTYDGEGLDDLANSIDLDDNGYVYVSGYTTKANGGKEILLLKYQSSGTQVWVRKQSASDGSNNAEAKKIAVDYNGNVYLTGEINTGINKNSITIKYDTDGNKKWERIFNKTGNENIKPLDINRIDDVVYVTAKSKQGAQDKFVTIKYKELAPPNVPVYDSTGNPSHIAHEIIVRFDRSSLLMNSINRKTIEFGTLNEFVNTSTISLMNSKIGLAVSSMGNLTAIKIFKTLMPSDSISISRLGDTVKTPDFWATFLIELPTNFEEKTTADSLNKCTPNIWYAELNPVIKVTDVPDDIKYVNEQASLHPTISYPNANINVESAWDKEKGKSFIKVGVYDSGIDQDHDDLNGKVLGGANYVANTSLSPPYDNLGHGTGCAGIIGALRNNNTGIAGIAGGDVASNNNNSGCSLYNMRIISDADNLGTGSLVSNAIIDGAKSTSIGGYGLNIMSNSWGAVSYDPNLISGFIGIMHDAVEFANNNKVAFIAARGNNGNDNALYPSCYSDQLVINVGASGTDGEYKSTTNGDNWWASSYGKNVDIMAPGTTEIVTTLQSGNDGYRTFNGTSAATPHVAGVAAIMMSYLNNPNMPNAYINLAPEDVEAILQYSATDKGAAGYDDYAGWGLLNASQAMNLIEKPKYKIQHIQTFNNAATTITPSLYQSQATIDLTHNYQGVSSGLYKADIYQSLFTLDYTLSSPTDQILHVWPRFSSSQGWSLSNPISTENFVEIVSATSTHAVLRNYYYHLTSVLGTTQTMDVWFPSQGNSNAGFTIHTYDPNAVGINEIKDQNALNLFNVFPNPANNSATFGYSLPESGTISLQLFDMQGRLIKTIFNGEQQQGIHTSEHDLTGIAQGLYVYTLTVGKKKMQKKLSIIH